MPKSAAPKFLSVSQLPPHPTSSWTAGPVTEGFPEELGVCVSTEGVLDYDYRHRQFRTDLDTSAVQLTVVTGTAAQAKALAKHYQRRRCPAFASSRVRGSRSAWGEGVDRQGAVAVHAHPVGELGEDLLRLKAGASGNRAQPAAHLGGQPHLRFQLIARPAAPSAIRHDGRGHPLRSASRSRVPALRACSGRRRVSPDCPSGR